MSVKLLRYIKLVDVLHNLAIQWGFKQLDSAGYDLETEQPEIVQDTPWSYVIRFKASLGYVYLKQTPEKIALEPRIIEALHKQFNVPVPEIIAHNDKLHCFLMKDAGQPLRPMLKVKFDEALLCNAVSQFLSIQQVVADDVDILLNIGVPDYRLDKLPELYQALISKTDILMADGLSKKEISRLEGLYPTVSNLCHQLSSYGIKETLVQPDFNDNNMLVNHVTKKFTIIDLGEVVISHPFFSLLNFLFVIKKHHRLTDDSEGYLVLERHCFNPFQMDTQDLFKATELARKLFFIYAALSNYRLRCACDETQLTGEFQRHGRVDPPLQALIGECDEN
ncbi:MAG: aminoglycoside phosphotransferase family protein [Gammaproteobacteria bacterium]|nr:aminoglycoside phosphotransferase family protein [Gammaproteobacteria bacterium]